MRTLTKPSSSIVSGLKALKKLDLKTVAKKLMEPKPEGQGWTLEQVREAEKHYRRFLELGVRYPLESIVPNLPIDQFWHQHILDTRAYATDCDNIFGEFLHHFPYFGLRGEEDAANRDSAFDRTNELYRLHFGEDCCNMTTFSKSGVPEDCMVSVRGNNGSPYQGGGKRQSAMAGVNCGGGGSGTGCRQGCSRGK